MGTISRLKRPDSWADLVRFWPLVSKSSASSRVIPYLPREISAVSAI